jgi:YggT family protein
LSVVAALGAVLVVLRTVFLFAAIFCAVVVALDWLVRTRRISPFSPVSRFVRSTVDPLLAPVERRVVRAGGLPSSAPWWALVAVVVGGILTLTALEFILGQVASLVMATRMGGRGIIFFLVRLLLTVLNAALLVRVVSSWVGVSPYSKWVRWSYTLTEPILAPLRQVIPNLGPIDITPIVAYFLLSLIGSWILRSLGG